MAASRLYNYYFEGIEKPLSIHSISQESADHLFREMMAHHPEMAGIPVVHQNSTSLVTGITSVQKDGKTLVWNGQQFVPEEHLQGSQ